MGDCFL
jgi:hypothetical protein